MVPHYTSVLTAPTPHPALFSGSSPAWISATGLPVGFTSGDVWQEISRRKEKAKVIIPLSPFLIGHFYLSPLTKGPCKVLTWCNSLFFWILVTIFYSCPIGRRMVSSWLLLALVYYANSCDSPALTPFKWILLELLCYFTVLMFP